jgi:CRISPR/Cas system-associated endonuclease Cas1
MLGFLHQPDYGRASLMLDALEVFRPMIDSLVLRLINRRQIGVGDFVRQSTKTVEEILSDQPNTLAELPFDEEPDVLQPPSGDEVEPTEVPATGVTTSGADDGKTGGNGSGQRGDSSWAVLLSDVGRRIFLHELFRRMREKMLYPPRSATYEIRDIVREQVYHLARVIAGEENEFEPFVPA